MTDIKDATPAELLHELSTRDNIIDVYIDKIESGKLSKESISKIFKACAVAINLQNHDL